MPARKIVSELLFDVISTACERQCLIVTTNLPFENRTGVLSNERLTGAILERLTHRSHILEASGESLNGLVVRRQSRSSEGLFQPDRCTIHPPIAPLSHRCTQWLRRFRLLLGFDDHPHQFCKRRNIKLSKYPTTTIRPVCWTAPLRSTSTRSVRRPSRMPRQNCRAPSVVWPASECCSCLTRR